MPWRPLGAYLAKNMTFMRRDFNDWNFWEWLSTDGSFKTCKALVYEAGATAPSKVLIWWKSGQNLQEHSKTLWKISAKMAPNMLWIENNGAQFDMKSFFFGGHFFKDFSGKFGRSGKNPSQSRKFACSFYTYAAVLEVYWIFVVFNKNFMGSDFFGSPCICR